MSNRRGDRFLSFVDLPVAGIGAGLGVVAPQIIPKPDELTWWDWAVLLLHTATEIEHALMVQYLYGAYSLARADFTGTAVPAGAATRTAIWRRTITSIAKEEMAHLLTEQNLLRFIGGPLHFDRGDFPWRSMLYPFPLALRPLTKTSLATYIAAEMPADPAVPDIAEILARATNAEGGQPINRVGVLFDTLINVFADDTKLAEADLRGQTVDDQASANDWRVSGHLIVRTVSNRAGAVAALVAIAEQGEGSANPPSGAPPSHFDQFLRIYREFPKRRPRHRSGCPPVRSRSIRAPPRWPTPTRRWNGDGSPIRRPGSGLGCSMSAIACCSPSSRTRCTFRGRSQMSTVR